MKKIHYRNIGFPKTGTNWLWVQMSKNRHIDGRFNDIMYKEFKPKTLTKYKETYNSYNITYNLDPHIFDFNIESWLQPDNIHEHTTHLTMILRSPYEVLNSMYNMEKNRNPNLEYTKDDYTLLNSNIVQRYTNFTGIFNYWKNCKLPIKFMFYDDLLQDPKQFVFEIYNYLNITTFYDSSVTHKFVTDKKDKLIFDNQPTINYINKEISLLEKKFGRDLSHWKK